MVKNTKSGQPGDKLMQVGQNMNNLGNKLIKKVTLPIILIILGAATFPLGIIFWLIALGLIAS